MTDSAARPRFRLTLMEAQSRPHIATWSAPRAAHAWLPLPHPPHVCRIVLKMLERSPDMRTSISDLLRTCSRMFQTGEQTVEC